MKIVLATDGSKYSKAAVQEVAKKPFPSNTKVLVLSSYERTSIVLKTQLSMGAEAEFYAQLDAEAHKLAKDTVKKAVKLIKEYNPELSVTQKVIEGAAKKVILEEAQKFGADLIVVGSQGKGALTRFMLGSVSQALAIHAPCSVLIVRKNKKVNKK